MTDTLASHQGTPPTSANASSAAHTQSGGVLGLQALNLLRRLTVTDARMGTLDMSNDDAWDEAALEIQQIAREARELLAQMEAPNG